MMQHNEKRGALQLWASLDIDENIWGEKKENNYNF